MRCLIVALSQLRVLLTQEMRRRLAKEMGPGWLVQFLQQGEQLKLVKLQTKLFLRVVNCYSIVFKAHTG